MLQRPDNANKLKRIPLDSHEYRPLLKNLQFSFFLFLLAAKIFTYSQSRRDMDRLINKPISVI